MNKELLKKRLTEIEASISQINRNIQQLMANLNVSEGGKMECLYWIEQLDKSEKDS